MQSSQFARTIRAFGGDGARTYGGDSQPPLVPAWGTVEGRKQCKWNECSTQNNGNADRIGCVVHVLYIWMCTWDGESVRVFPLCPLSLSAFTVQSCSRGSRRQQEAAVTSHTSFPSLPLVDTSLHCTAPHSHHHGEACQRSRVPRPSNSCRLPAVPRCFHVV